MLEYLNVVQDTRTVGIIFAIEIYTRGGVVNLIQRITEHAHCCLRRKMLHADKASAG